MKRLRKVRKYNLTLLALSVLTLSVFSLSPSMSFALAKKPGASPRYGLIGQTTDSYGVTFAVSACKQVDGSDLTVNSYYSISPVNSTTVAHSSIWEAYSNTKNNNYLDYITANATAFNSNGTATDSYTTSKTVKTFMYWEGDYNPDGSGFTDAGSGVAVPSPFKPYNVKRLHNC